MSEDSTKGFEGFFKDGNLLQVVDTVARRYGRLPHELMREMSVADFNLNVAVMVAAIKAENERAKQQEKAKGGGFNPLSKFKMIRKTVPRK